MTKTIELTEVLVKRILLDYTAQVVKVDYIISDANGDEWSKGTAFFWVNLPVEPTPNDFQLPSSYFSILTDLRQDADTAITNRFFV